jgi:hypothetical protein
MTGVQLEQIQHGSQMYLFVDRLKRRNQIYTYIRERRRPSTFTLPAPFYEAFLRPLVRSLFGKLSWRRLYYRQKGRYPVESL